MSEWIYVPGFCGGKNHCRGKDYPDSGRVEIRVASVAWISSMYDWIEDKLKRGGKPRRKYDIQGGVHGAETKRGSSGKEYPTWGAQIGKVTCAMYGLEECSGGG